MITVIGCNLPESNHASSVQLKGCSKKFTAPVPIPNNISEVERVFLCSLSN